VRLLEHNLSSDRVRSWHSIEHQDFTPMVSALLADSPPKRLSLLGAAGSIGRSCAQVIATTPGRFWADPVAIGHDGGTLAIKETLVCTGQRAGARIAALGTKKLRCGKLSGTL